MAVHAGLTILFPPRNSKTDVNNTLSCLKIIDGTKNEGVNV